MVMTSEHERLRLVILGGPHVGKSSILKRFLFNTYTDRYKGTVEDLYTREFDLGAMTIKVDILDTCGDLEFPAMRRLSIATAHAFLLVYSIDSLDSLARVQACMEEVREQRPDFQEVPIVVAGNKCDVKEKAVPLEDVSEWVYCQLPRLRVKLMECSAKENVNIKEIFKCFVMLAKILPPTGDDQSGLKRRSSAYVKGGNRRGGSPANLNVTDESTSSGGSSKPRSRSLIRRSSRKTKQLQSECSGADNDCKLS